MNTALGPLEVSGPGDERAVSGAREADVLRARWNEVRAGQVQEVNRIGGAPEVLRTGQSEDSIRFGQDSWVGVDRAKAMPRAVEASGPYRLDSRNKCQQRDENDKDGRPHQTRHH